MKDLLIEKTVEILCEKGCQSVREDIKKLENNQEISETAGLNKEQLGSVLEELKSIMSVYGNSCSIDGSVEITHSVITDITESTSGS